MGSEQDDHLVCGIVGLVECVVDLLPSRIIDRADTEKPIEIERVPASVIDFMEPGT
jgi:hypothetical protein